MARVGDGKGAEQESFQAQRGDPYTWIAQLETVLQNMPQGVCMFDAGRRLIVCNHRYAEIFGLPPELTTPGTSLLDILKFRAAAGLVPGDDAEAYIRSRLEIADRNAPSKSLLELKDGRVFSVAHEPMAGGGWVSTHEDITEQTRIDRELANTRAFLVEARAQAESAAARAQSAHQLLLEAFDLVPEGLVLLDNQDRYVLWNKRIEDFYSETEGGLAGVTFEERLRNGLANRQFPAAVGREDAWLAERMALHASPRSDHEQQLPGGRWVRIEERRTRDGGTIGIRVDITELKRRQESFRLLFDGNPIPMWVYDRESLRFLAVNDAAVEHYGYSREQFLAMTILDIRPKEDRALVKKLAWDAEATYEKGWSWRHTKADGVDITVATYARSINYDGCNGQLVCALDITERVRARDELRRAQEFLNLVIESVPEAIFVRDARSGRFTLLNRAAEEFLGVPRADVIGKTAAEVYPPETAEGIARRDEELLRKGELLLDGHPIITPKKGERLVTLTRKLLKNSDGEPQYILAVIQDITERRRDEERITHLAHHDLLTDLPNRVLFGAHLAAVSKRAADAGERFALLCIDLDRLKEVNDVFGHAAGDQLLCEVSRRLLAACGDAFLARLGGDEFALIAENVHRAADIAALTDGLLAAIASDLDIGGVRIRAGLSIGVAIFPDDGRDTTTLVANADAALYRAKAEGRGVARLFKSDMDNRLREGHAMRHDLGAAIERGELTLFYQPQAKVTGEIIGFEALLRWRHPVRGWVPPNAFIPIAEESQLIVAIGEWVLRDVCREAASWPRSLGVAVNLSPVQFQHGDLPSLVHSILLETGLAANRLELEVTEGVLMANTPGALAVLRRLKALGVRIAMDDFGKGYSSLSYLQSFSFDKIKIDRTFVTKVSENWQSAVIFRAVLVLARGLQLTVIAEGVETEEELAFLAAEACDQVQGYLIGRPLPIEDYAEVTGSLPPSAKLRLQAR